MGFPMSSRKATKPAMLVMRRLSRKRITSPRLTVVALGVADLARSRSS
jgi:hypothetical protein